MIAVGRGVATSVVVSGFALAPLGASVVAVSADALDGCCNPIGLGPAASVRVSADALEDVCNHAAPRIAASLEGDCDQTTAPAMASVNHAVNARMLRNFSGALREGSATIRPISLTVYSA